MSALSLNTMRRYIKNYFHAFNVKKPKNIAVITGTTNEYCIQKIVYCLYREKISQRYYLYHIVRDDEVLNGIHIPRRYWSNAE